MKRKKKVLLNVVLTLVVLVWIFVANPNLNPLYAEGAFRWCVIFTCYVVLNFLLGFGGITVEQNNVGVPSVHVNRNARGAKAGFRLLAVCWGLFLVVCAASTVLFNYGAYRDQLGTPEKAVFTDSVQPIAQDQLPIVDKALASELADKKLGENPGLGSQVMLGTPVIQQVNGKLVWAVPLEHSGFFKWLQNMDGAAGYIVVSATDVNDVKLVTDYKIKYQAGAYLLDDLERHTRLFGGALFRGITDNSFELDDSGKPHWVITTYSNRWLFALPEATGVLIVDATTGETTPYSMDNIPEWVDRVQPESFIMQQIQNQGEYVHGFLNFSNQDKFRPSEGDIIVYNGGDCYLFTGLTSVGSDESAIGFMMVNMVTKEAKMYQMSGATENAAKSSAEGKVQQYGYRATFPMIINLDGLPTYFMTLKDNAGLIKQYAFVSVETYTNVGTGETINAALRNYRQTLRENNSGKVDTSTGDETATGTVLRIANESIGDTVTYRVILKEQQNRIFTVPYDTSAELSLTQPGDRVKMDYLPGNNGVCSASTFDNLEFTQDSSEPKGEPESSEPAPESESTPAVDGETSQPESSSSNGEQASTPAPALSSGNPAAEPTGSALSTAPAA